MGKIYTSLGLMSGTSMDGIDASIIHSDGENEYESVFDKYFEYNSELYKELTDLRDKISSSKDLKSLSEIVKSTEKKITLFHVKAVKDVMKEKKLDLDLIGFHGQTIFHSANEKISKQLGAGNLLSSLTKNKVVYNFRKNDLANGGQGAPLTPVFHQLIANQGNFELPIIILNIGGIANLTIINSSIANTLKSYDLGPGNCLLDDWIRKKTKKNYDHNGEIAKRGNTNKSIVAAALDNFYSNKKKLSFDIKDFDSSLFHSLSLENGAATLSDFTGTIISKALLNTLNKNSKKLPKILICGGGRKNSSLIEIIKKKTLKNFDIQSIDNYGINGDFVESQAFAYLAVRSYLKLPISFIGTTGCKKSCTGGVIVRKF